MSIYPFCSSRKSDYIAVIGLVKSCSPRNCSGYIEPGLRPVPKPPQHIFTSHSRVEKAEVPVWNICWPSTWRVMCSSHHNHGNMNVNMTPKCAFSLSRLFSIHCFHTRALCLLNCCTVYILIVPLRSSDRIMITGLMIKQWHTVVTSIPATLASRNSDRAVEMLVLISENLYWYHPKEKGPIDRDTGTQEIRIWFKHDERGFPERLASLRWFISLGQKLHVLPGAAWVFSRYSAFLPHILSPGRIPASPSDCWPRLQHRLSMNTRWITENSSVEFSGPQLGSAINC